MTSSSAARAVVDTNIFVSGMLTRRGANYRLMEALRAQAFVLILSDPLYGEYGEVLSRPRFQTDFGVSITDVVAFLTLAGRGALFVTPRRRLPVVVRDPKDELVLATALGGKADYLVTHDDDLLILRGHRELGSLQIVTAVEFLDIIRSGRH